MSAYTDEKAAMRGKSYRQQVTDTLWMMALFVVGGLVGYCAR